jgi:hypothetical protein
MCASGQGSALNPDGATVFKTGYSFNQTTDYDYITVAYRG